MGNFGMNLNSSRNHLLCFMETDERFVGCSWLSKKGKASDLLIIYVLLNFHHCKPKQGDDCSVSSATKVKGKSWIEMIFRKIEGNNEGVLTRNTKENIKNKEKTN